jgi:site-specific DNA recombinase
MPPDETPESPTSGESTIPAILYAAKSTEDKHGSIPTQVADCRAMAEREGWMVMGEFRDEGFSAYRRSRGPGLEAAKHRAEALAAEPGRCILLAQHSDRFARGAGDAPDAADHLAEVMFWARRHNVELRSVQDDSNLTNPLLAFVMGERNYEDSRRKGEAVKAGIRRRVVERRQCHATWRNYGYERREGRLHAVAHEAEVVRRIYAERLAGKAKKPIVRGLNADGIPSRDGGLWSARTLTRLLRNPVYVGGHEFNGEVVPCDHESLVDEATWGGVQEVEQDIAAATRRPVGEGRHPGRPTKEGRHLFTWGALRCGECGSAMRSRTHRRKHGPPQEVYICRGRETYGVDHCSQTPAPRELIDAAVFAHFETVALDYEGSRAHYTAHNARELAEVEARLAEAERSAMRAAAAIDKADEDWAAGTMDADNHGRLVGKFGAQREAAEAQVAQLQKRRMEVAAASALRDDEDFLGELTKLRTAIGGSVREANGIEAVRAALLRIFEGFVLHRVDSPHAPGTVPLDLLVAEGGVAFVIEPHEREDAVMRPTGPLVPLDMATFMRSAQVLRREPVHLAPDANKGALSHASAAAASGSPGARAVAARAIPSKGATTGAARALAGTE